jgi:hypothetical protein
MAEPLDRHAHAFDRLSAGLIAQRRPDALETAERRAERGVAAAAGADRQAHDVGGPFADLDHIRRARADILRRHIAAAKSVDRPPHRPEQSRRLPPRIGDDDGFAAAEGQSGHGGLHAHAARQAKHVRQRRPVVGIGQDAAAPRSRPELGAVDCDDCLQAGRRIAGEDDLLVIIEISIAENHMYCPCYSAAIICRPAPRSGIAPLL